MDHTIVTAATTATLSVTEWLQIILLGLVTGALGQVIRQIASLKKILDGSPTDKLGVLLDWTRIVINLLIGATAGVIGVLSIDIPPTGLDTKTVLSLVGFGYAGADFIESFMRKAEPPKPSDPTPNQANTNTVPAAAPTPGAWPIPQAKG